MRESALAREGDLGDRRIHAERARRLRRVEVVIHARQVAGAEVEDRDSDEPSVTRAIGGLERRRGGAIEELVEFLRGPVLRASGMTRLDVAPVDRGAFGVEFRRSEFDHEIAVLPRRASLRLRRFELIDEHPHLPALGTRRALRPIEHETGAPEVGVEKGAILGAADASAHEVRVAGAATVEVTAVVFVAVELEHSRDDSPVGVGARIRHRREPHVDTMRGMILRTLAPTVALLASFVSCGSSVVADGAQTSASPAYTFDRAAADAQVRVVLDDFHAAAAAAELERYLGHFAEEGVFLGTDETERWTLPEFRAFCEPWFAQGKGWKYVPTTRHVAFAPDGDVAWFDESLWNETYGATRGTGVLRRVGSDWKIAQYNLTFTIPNEQAKRVVEMLRSGK